MSDVAQRSYHDFVLPLNVVSKADVSRLVREAEWLNNELTTIGVRAKVGQPSIDHPPVSDQLRDFFEENKLSFEVGSERAAVIKQLRQLKEKSPVIHITFAVVADGESLQSLVAWIRTTLHPQAVITVSIQPALVAGVYVRTPNHVYDMSLRGKLAGHHELLSYELEALSGR
ncbi:MAG: F0F1 ATP synthase subunit delta [Candidatus Saccharimonadales bacterium]